MIEKNHSIPNGVDHLVMIDRFAEATAAQSTSRVKDAEQSRFIGIALCALYQAATCHRRCWKTGHLLEALSGRAYNLASSAYLLIVRGFYDEGLNLVRGIGEIANLVSLSAVDKQAFRRWLEADAKARRRDFSPAAIRKVLEQKGRELMYADQDWYSRLCEEYTHVSPGTRPNLHNKAGLPVVGGIFQPEGLHKALEELSNVLGFLALQICKYFEFDDLFEQLVAELRANAPSDKSG